MAFLASAALVYMSSESSNPNDESTSTSRCLRGTAGASKSTSSYILPDVLEPAGWQQLIHAIVVHLDLLVNDGISSLHRQHVPAGSRRRVTNNKRSFGLVHQVVLRLRAIHVGGTTNTAGFACREESYRRRDVVRRNIIAGVVNLVQKKRYDCSGHW